MHINLVKRYLAIHELQSHHDHPGDPEENDVEACYQHTGGVELFQTVGIFRPAESGEGPEC